MIKPVEVGLRITAILAKAVVEMVGAPLEAFGRIMVIVAAEILTPFTQQMTRLITQLEAAAKEEPCRKSETNVPA